MINRQMVLDVELELLLGLRIMDMMLGKVIIVIIRKNKFMKSIFNQKARNFTTSANTFIHFQFNLLILTRWETLQKS